MLRDLAREFAEQDHIPVVIVPMAGAQVPWQVESDAGVEVLRLAADETREESLARRAMAELLLPFRMLRNLRRSAFAETRWDIVAWYSPPIFFAPLIRAMKRASGAHAYLILRDIFPEWALDLGVLRKGPAYYALKAIASFQYAVADTIGVQTQGNLKFVQSWATGKRRVEVLHNWLADEPITTCRIDISATKLAGRTVFVYIGNMGVAQNIDTFIELAIDMRDRREVGFLFVGRGSERYRLEKVVASHALDNVIFQAEISPSEIPGLLAQCHVGLVALDPRHTTHNIPGKFLAYARSGLAILARINSATDLERLIVENDLGRVYSGTSLSELRSLTEALVSDPAARRVMGERAMALAERLFKPEVAVKAIVSACNRSARQVASNEY